jgi:hypothetical protein
MINMAYRLITFTIVNVSNNELKLLTISTVLKSNTVAGDKKNMLFNKFSQKPTANLPLRW